LRRFERGLSFMTPIPSILERGDLHAPKPEKGVGQKPRKRNDRYTIGGRMGKPPESPEILSGDLLRQSSAALGGLERLKRGQRPNRDR